MDTRIGKAEFSGKPETEIAENVTNEAESDEGVTIIQNKEPVQVAANSGVVPGLESGQKH